MSDLPNVDATESELPAGDESELLDDDVLPPEYPPERPLGVDEYGTTWQEERVDEPLEERVRREEPDVVDLDPDADLDGVDVEEGADDLEGTAVLPAADRLDDGDPVAGDPSRRDVATERVAAPAEEAAVHVVDDGGA